MQKVLISILHYKNQEATLKCLDSLEKSEKSGLFIELLLIDNNSPEKLKVDESNFPSLRIRTLYLEKNLGFAGGHNLAFDYLLNNDFDFLLLLNNDAVVEKDAIIELVEASKRHSRVGITVPKIYFTKNHEFHKARYKPEELGRVIWYAGGKTDWKNIVSFHIGVDEVDNGQFDEERATEFATGACMLISRKAVEEVGDFDEKFFLYYEDGDLNMRMKKHGYSILYAPKAVAWHNNAGSSGSGSELQDYYISRNRMLFGMRYAPLRARVSLIRESLTLLKSGRKWQKRGIADFYLKKFGKGSFAL